MCVRVRGGGGGGEGGGMVGGNGFLADLVMQAAYPQLQVQRVPG